MTGMLAIAALGLSLLGAGEQPVPPWLKPKGKVLIITSSHNVLGASGAPTGVWPAEVAHPYAVLTNARWEVEFANPKGGAFPWDPMGDPENPRSPARFDVTTLGFLKHPLAQQRVREALPLSAVKTEDYAAVLISGGSAAMFDLPQNPDVQRIVAGFFNAGKPVAAFCHGVSALLNVKDAEGRLLVKDREVTSFTMAEEEQAAKVSGRDVKSYSPVGLLEDELIRRGALYRKGPPFQPFVVKSADGRLLTGQQPYSGMALSSELAAMLEARLTPRTVP
jgi:putative intracellular protease/amidase